MLAAPELELDPGLEDIHLLAPVMRGVTRCVEMDSTNSRVKIIVVCVV